MEKIKITYEDYERIQPVLAAIREAAPGKVKEKRVKRSLEKGKPYDRIYIEITWKGCKAAVYYPQTNKKDDSTAPAYVPDRV